MKPRTQFLITVGLILVILGIAWLSYSTRNREPTQVIPATINRDCTPWDGPAFTVSIPLNDGITIHISIWQSPDIKRPARFSFPDETGQIGFAYILPEPDSIQPLSGDLSFIRVKEGIPVEGEFNFTTESGEEFKGKFNAVWGNQVVYCG